MNIYSLLEREEEKIMPNQDGTGPEGKGSLTGRKRGKCKGATPCQRKMRKCRGQGRGIGVNKE
jgi:hypothetical protein